MRAAHIFGITLTTGLTDIKYEYTETVGKGETWYTHHMYPDGFTYHGFIIGNAAGGNARNHLCSISHDFKWGNLKLNYNYIKKGFNISSTLERNRIYSIEFEKNIDYKNLFNLKVYNWRFYAGFTYNDISNFNYSREDKEIYIFSLGTNISF